jgi:hypothetical protein
MSWNDPEPPEVYLRRIAILLAISVGLFYFAFYYSAWLTEWE